MNTPNPMLKWRLEEIQSMLNEIDGYENVRIELQYTPSGGWNSDHYDCTCGLKERLVNGQWNWLLKYTFQIDDKHELGEVRLAAFEEMTKRLIADVWRTSVDSLRKRQQEINKINMTNNKLEAFGDYAEEYAARQKQLNKELVDRKLMEMELENITTEKMNTNNNIQTNTTNTDTDTSWTESEPVRWIASGTIVATFLYAMYSLYKYELILPTFFTLACIYGVGVMIMFVKESINRLLD